MENDQERRETTLTLRVSATEAREARLAAKAEGVTVSELIRRAVRDRAEALTVGSGR